MKSHARAVLLSVGVNITLGGCGGAQVPVPQARATTPPDSPAGAAAPRDGGDGSADSGALEGVHPPTPMAPTFRAIALPGAGAPASLDYIAYEAARGRVWIPVGNSGSVDVFDPANGQFTVVGGFTTAEREGPHGKRTVGPSAVSLGDGFAYVGDRATSEVCAVDANTLRKGACLTLPSPTDGVAYVRSAKEVWVTMPRSRAIAVLDAASPAALKMKSIITLEGAPEGYAVDDARGLFFTNLEDADKTVVIDIRSHHPKDTWALDCGSTGPRGVAVDAARGFVFVACTDHVTVRVGARGGARVATIDAGEGVDNIDWLESRRWLYAAAGKSARLTIVHVDDDGQPRGVASSVTTDGARNGIADVHGNAYVTDSIQARLLVFAVSP